MAVRVSSMKSFSPQVADSLSFSDALDNLYRRYAPKLVRLCAARLGDASQAEDVCHESLLKAARAMSGVQRPQRDQKAWPWLATIATHECIDYLRSRQREALRDRKLPRPQVVPAVDTWDFAQMMRIGLAKETLNRLPVTYRAYLRLHYFEEWPYRKIAHFCGVTLSEVKSAFPRAKRAFEIEIKKLAEARGQWPLPALVPWSWGRMRGAVERWLSATKDAGTEMWIRLGANSAETIGALLVGAAMTAVTVGTLLPNSAPATSNYLEENAPSVTEVLSPSTDPAISGNKSAVSKYYVQTSHSPSGQDNHQDGELYTIPSASKSVDVDHDGNDDAWLNVGSREIRCPEPKDRGVATAAACPIVQDIVQPDNS